MDFSQLFPQVYEELRGLAAVHFRGESSGITLQPTVLVHEVYLRLSSSMGLSINNRAHFLRLASRVMRQVLIDHARARTADKRGSNMQRVSLTGIDSENPDGILDALDLEAALIRLTAVNARRADLVELRFYGGLTMEEAADALEISLETAKREWRVARAWLARELASAAENA